MKLKRVLTLTALLFCVASVAYAQSNLVVGTLQMPVNGSGTPTATIDLKNNSAVITGGISTSTTAPVPGPRFQILLKRFITTR